MKTLKLSDLKNPLDFDVFLKGITFNILGKRLDNNKKISKRIREKIRSGEPF